MGWIANMWGVKTASEICGCGEPAVGVDSHNTPVCKDHTDSLLRWLRSHPDFNDDILEDPTPEQLAHERARSEVRENTPGICSVCLQHNASPDSFSSDHPACRDAKAQSWERLKPLVQDLPGWPNTAFTSGEAARTIMGVPDAGIVSPEHREFIKQVINTPSEEQLQAAYPHARTPHLGSWNARYASEKNQQV